MKKLVMIGLASLFGACGGGDDTVDGMASIDMSWSFTPTDGCQAGESIHFAFDPSPFTSDDIFDCLNGEHDPADQSGTIGAIPLGSYTIDASVFLNDQPELSVTPDSLSVNLDVDGQVLSRSVTFARGFSSYDVSFTYDFGGSGFTQNCADADTGTTDAGVINTEIELDDGTQCLAVSMTGTDQTGTPFDVDTCGAAFVCNEQDIVHTLNDVPPGAYTLTITGNKMRLAGWSFPCYVSSYTFDTSDATTQAFSLTPDPLVVMFQDVTECNETKPTRPGSGVAIK